MVLTLNSEKIKDQSGELTLNLKEIQLKILNPNPI